MLSFRVFCLLITIVLISACSQLGVKKTVDLPENKEQPAEIKTPADEVSKNGELSKNDKLPENEGIQANEDSPVQKQVVDPMAEQIIPELLKAEYQALNKLINENKLSQAKIKLEQLSSIYPQDTGVFYRLARIEYQLKNYPMAIEAIDKAVSFQPMNYYAFNLKGVILRETGEFDAAKQAYLSAISLYPNYPQTHLNLAILADIYLYDLPLALVHYEQYLSLISVEDKKVNGWLIDLKRRIPQ